MRVPEYQGGVEARGVPEARQRIGVSGESFLNPNAAAVVGGLAKSAEGLNAAAAHVYSQQVESMNAARVQEALTQLQTKQQDLLFNPQSGAYTQKGGAVFSQANSKPLTDNVVDALQEHAGDLAEGLGNEEQRALFAEHANALLTHTRGQLLQYEGEQAGVYRRGVGLGAIGANTNSVGLNYNNPGLIRQNLDAIKTASVDLAGLDGQPEALGLALAQGHISKALSGAFDAALQQGDHASAVQLLKQFSPDMDTETMLRLHGKLQEASQAAAAYHLGGAVMGQVAPLMQTSDQDRAFNVLLGAESGGRHFDETGKVVTSAVGAKGVGQLLPETAEETAKAAGLPWVPELFHRGATGDPALDKQAADYNLQLSRAYFDRQLRDFHGDLSLAYAAYNAGPGAVREALAASIKAGGAGVDGSPSTSSGRTDVLGSGPTVQGGSGAAGGGVAADLNRDGGVAPTVGAAGGRPKVAGDWLTYLPKETQAYVTKNMNAFATGQGAFKRPTLAAVVALANEQVDKTPGATEQFRKQVLEQVTNQYQLQTQAIKQRDEEGLAEAYRQLQANGGRFSDLPASVRAAVPPDKVDSMLNFARKIGNGEEPETDWGLYYRLKTDKRLLRETNLMAFRNKLADEEFKQLANDQQDMSSGKGFTLSAVRSPGDILHSFMLQAGINPTPKPGDKAGVEQVGKIWSAYEQRVAAWESINGKKAGTAELEKIGAELFTRVPVAGVLFGTNEKPAVLVDQAKDKVVVPEVDRQLILAAFAKERPGEVPSDETVRALYLRGLGL